MSLIGNIRIDIGDDGAVISGSGTTQSAGGLSNSLIRGLRVDTGDDGITVASSGTTQAAGVIGNSTIMGIRVDVGDDSAIIPSSGVTQAAGVISNNVIRGIRVDVGDDDVIYSPNFRIITEPGPVYVLSSDNILFIDKTIGEPTQINFSQTLARGQQIVIKDFKGDASVNNIIIQANVDGDPFLVIDSDYQSYTLVHTGSFNFGII